MKNLTKPKRNKSKKEVSIDLTFLKLILKTIDTHNSILETHTQRIGVLEEKQNKQAADVLSVASLESESAKDTIKLVLHFNRPYSDAEKNMQGMAFRNALYKLLEEYQIQGANVVFKKNHE